MSGENAPDVLGRVDDLLDARHPQRDVHGGHPGEVEGLQGHLGARLPDALGAHCPHGRARLHLCPVGTDSTHHLRGHAICCSETQGRRSEWCGGTSMSQTVLLESWGETKQINPCM